MLLQLLLLSGSLSNSPVGIGPFSLSGSCDLPRNKLCSIAEGFRDSGIGSQGIKNSLAVRFLTPAFTEYSMHTCVMYATCMT